jgi:hypothetical protein
MFSPAISVALSDITQACYDMLENLRHVQNEMPELPSEAVYRQRITDLFDEFLSSVEQLDLFLSGFQETPLASLEPESKEWGGLLGTLAGAQTSIDEQLLVLNGMISELQAMPNKDRNLALTGVLLTEAGANIQDTYEVIQVRTQMIQDILDNPWLAPDELPLGNGGE